MHTASVMRPRLSYVGNTRVEEEMGKLGLRICFDAIKPLPVLILVEVSIFCNPISFALNAHTAVSRAKCVQLWEHYCEPLQVQK